MGYNTTLDMELYLNEGKFEEFIKEIQEHDKKDHRFEGGHNNWSDWGFYIDEEKCLQLPDSNGKFYEIETTVKIISKYFNGWIEGQGDDSDDKWRYVMENGKLNKFIWEWVACHLDSEVKP